jgi:uncharacterized protein (DUF4415 family)
VSDWIDPDDAPELTEDFFHRAEIREGGKLIRAATGALTRAGRPPVGAVPKQQVSLRLDQDVVSWFRAQGAGWQTRINEVLKREVRK